MPDESQGEEAGIPTCFSQQIPKARGNYISTILIG
jgi:hypothetical protein